MESSRQNAYLNDLLRSHSNEWMSRNLSAVTTGSSAMGCKDEHSDWDLKLFFDVEECDGHSTFHTCIEDNSHIPPVFVLVRPLSFLVREFSENLPVMLWVYSTARVLRDDGGRFEEVVENQRSIFAEKLPQLINNRYLRFRSTRHSITGALKRGDKITTQILTGELIRQGFELLHLIKGKPHPYTQWLNWSTSSTLEIPEDDYVVVIPKQLLAETIGAGIERISRDFVKAVIDHMVIAGFSRERLDLWWRHI